MSNEEIHFAIAHAVALAEGASRALASAHESLRPVVALLGITPMASVSLVASSARTRTAVAQLQLLAKMFGAHAGERDAEHVTEGAP